jgi:hypothetical protein
MEQHTGGTTRALNNIAFVAGNTGKFYADAVTRFDAGDPYSTAAVTGTPANIFNATGSIQLPGTAKILSADQFDGFIINNGTNPVAKLIGSEAGNDAGALQLLNNNVQTQNLSADANGVRAQGSGVLMLGLPTTCTAHPSGTLINVAGVANICP